MKKPISLIGLLLLVIAECAQLSAHPNKELEIFSAEVVERITIDAGFGWGIFGGSVYNGNSDYRQIDSLPNYWDIKRISINRRAISYRYYSTPFNESCAFNATRC